MALDETVKRLRTDIYHCRQIGRVDAFVALSDLDTIIDAADLLCRLDEMNVDACQEICCAPSLRDALEAARREQAREGGGSDGK